MTQEEITTLSADCNALLDIFNRNSPVQEAKKFNLEAVQNTVYEMIDKAVSNKEEAEAFKAWLDTHEFWKSPASTKFHGDWESGLCVHSLMVTVQALRFAPCFAYNYTQAPLGKNFTFTAEDVFISSIAHDLCKAGSYKIEFHNTKDIHGNWTKKPVYKTKTELRNIGHGNESVLLLLESMPSLIKKRYVIEAISRHMGFSDLSDMEKMNYSNFLQNPLVVLIQTADQTSAAWYDC